MGRGAVVVKVGEKGRKEGRRRNPTVSSPGDTSALGCCWMRDQAGRQEREKDDEEEEEG